MTGDPESDKRWFYVQDGRRKGPVGASRLVEMILGEVISEDTLVWHSGLDKWVEAHSVEELRHQLPPPVPDTEDDDDPAGARAEAESLADEAAGGGESGAENGRGPQDGSSRSSGRRRRRHRPRYRLTGTRHPRWLVPLVIMVIVVIVVVWYMLRRINEVPPGQIVPTGAIVETLPPTA